LRSAALAAPAFVAAAAAAMMAAALARARRRGSGTGAAPRRVSSRRLPIALSSVDVVVSPFFWMKEVVGRLPRLPPQSLLPLRVPPAAARRGRPATAGVGAAHGAVRQAAAIPRPAMWRRRSGEIWGRCHVAGAASSDSWSAGRKCPAARQRLFIFSSSARRHSPRPRIPCCTRRRNTNRFSSLTSRSCHSLACVRHLAWLSSVNFFPLAVKKRA
jgi:hypothetical protein